MEMLRPAPDFKHQLAKVDLTVDELVELVGTDNINRSTVFAWLNPKEAERPRAVRLNKAWKVARAYAQHTGISPEEAFDRLFIEVKESANVIAASDQ